MVNGNAPPPCANATRSVGNRSNTPPKIMEQIARDVSAGIATSHGSQYFGSGPDRLKRCIIEVQSIYTPKIRIGINVSSDLRAAQPELPDAPFQFARGEVGILHWNSAQARETRRMISDH